MIADVFLQALLVGASSAPLFVVVVVVALAGSDIVWPAGGPRELDQRSTGNVTADSVPQGDAVQPARVGIAKRIPGDVAVGIDAAVQPDWITLDVSAGDGVVVAVVVVVQPGLV